MLSAPRPGSEFCISNTTACLRGLSASREWRKHFLVIGPGLALQSWKEGEVQSTSSYLKNVVTRIVEWCIDKDIFKQECVIDEFLRLLQKDALAHVIYELEEYLVERSWLQQCLADVLSCDNELANIYSPLVRIPFRGYISTTYDTLIETIYEQVHGKKLLKYYMSSIQEAVVACQQKQPFLLKLYGDVSDSNSLILRQRLTKGLFAINGQEALRSMLALSPSLFVGFEEDDLEFKALKGIIKNDKLADQHTSTDLPVYHIRPILSEEQRHWQSEHYGSAIREFPQNWQTISLPSVTDPYIFQSIHAEPVTQDSQTSTPSSSAQPKSQQRAVHNRPIEVFMAYTGAKEDKNYFNRIDTILEGIKQQKSDWCIDYKKFVIYQKASEEAKLCLTSAHLVLLLVSWTFISTDFSTCKQMEDAVARHGPDFCLLPIRIHPIDDWESLLFGRLEALPESGQAFSLLRAKQIEILAQIRKTLMQKIPELRLANRLT